MSNFAREVLREQPVNVIQFGKFERLIEITEFNNIGAEYFAKQLKEASENNEKSRIH